MAGDIAAVLGDSIADFDGSKISDLLVCGNEVLGKQFANFGV